MNRKKEKKRGSTVKLYLIICGKTPIMKIVSKLAMSEFTHGLLCSNNHSVCRQAGASPCRKISKKQQEEQS